MSRQIHYISHSHVTHVDSRDKHRLVLAVLHHVSESAISNGVEMRRHLGPPLATVLLYERHLVDWQTLVRVDGDTEQARIRLQT